jgi:hypothetical protein
MTINRARNWLALKWAMWRWTWAAPFIGDEQWGKGLQRRKNLAIAYDRWSERKPDCRAFGFEHRYLGGEEHCCRCGHKRAAAA